MNSGNTPARSMLVDDTARSAACKEQNDGRHEDQARDAGSAGTGDRALFGARTAGADPPLSSPPQTWTCTNGLTFTVNVGTLNNQSSNAFLIDSTRMFILKTLVVTLDGNVIYYSFDRGSEGVANVLSCSANPVPTSACS